ncbi:hypothetical protein BDN72DRAFT_332882 [Pluteus cervinus]|uniref:Uncharacterized protein n=1 Tax=Pluteus cervinus TaxID=181527 RepID=A0ACD3AC28_9AGAR|nr:hypothetical protein BDN72DRAFT_332882 [Pluteus cervinus]
MALKPLHERLPRELLSHIFTIFCEEGGARSRVLLLTICREWQNTCYSTHALWCEVTIITHHRENPEPGTGLTLAEMASRAKTWLSRSGTLSCSLRISAGPNHYTDGAPAFEGLINFVSPRLQRLVMRAPTHEFRVFNKLLPDGLPELNELSVTQTHMGDRVVPFVDFSFCRCKKLRVVGLSFDDPPGLPVWKIVPLFNNITSLLPLQQLRTLAFHDAQTGVAESAKAISLCTSLETCKFSLGSWSGRTTPPDIPPTTLPNLRVLKLGLFEYQAVLFLQPFRMPALTELDLTSQGSVFSRIRGSFSSALLELHKRHPFPLRKLSLKDVALETGIFLNFLSRLEHLEEFATTSCDCLAMFLTKILTMELDTTPPFLPQLAHLEIQEKWDLWAPTDNNILLMIKSRWSQGKVPSVARLKRVTIADQHVLHKEFIREFELMSKEGLQFHVRGFGNNTYLPFNPRNRLS